MTNRNLFSGLLAILASLAYAQHHAGYLFLLSALTGQAQKTRRAAKADRAPKPERVEQTISEIMKAQEDAWNRSFGVIFIKGNKIGLERICL